MKSRVFRTVQGFNAWRNHQHSVSAAFKLEKHCENAHNGQIDPNCNACKELKAQAERAQ